MLALTVEISTTKQTGTIGDTGKPYTTYKPVFTIVGDGKEPTIEMDSGRISFLVEAAGRFREIALTSSVNDEEQNDISGKTQPKEDIPFS